MTTISSPSSSSPHDDNVPTATLALPSIAASSASSRRLPPPCWTPDETVALIDAYKDKWYSLRRSNLRANHWQEVADAVALRCPATPAKTAVQCRHKMEKLRKRYRAEIQRAAAHGGVRRYTSSWAHFQNMHSMEKGSEDPSPPASSSSDGDEYDRYNYNRNRNGVFSNQGAMGNGSTPGVRIKIPGGGPTAAAKVYNKFGEIGTQNPNPNPRFPNLPIGYGVASNRVSRGGFLGKKFDDDVSKKNEVDGGVGEVVAAIQALGEGFMKMEKAKMDMLRQIEDMRMEMEMKRTEMILDSQKRIVDSFTKAILERSSKKAKTMPGS